jgi:prophage regulatory protein
MNTTQPAAADGFLRLPQVLERIPISRSGWWQGVKDGRFPQPVKLSPRVTVWRAADIQAYIDAAGQGAK